MGGQGWWRGWSKPRLEWSCDAPTLTSSQMLATAVQSCSRNKRVVHAVRSPAQICACLRTLLAHERVPPPVTLPMVTCGPGGHSRVDAPAERVSMAAWRGGDRPACSYNEAHLIAAGYKSIRTVLHAFCRSLVSKSATTTVICSDDACGWHTLEPTQYSGSGVMAVCATHQMHQHLWWCLCSPAAAVVPPRASVVG